MPDPHVVLHVGLPKTGTTFLQEVVFPRLDGVDMPYLDDAPLVRAFRDAVQANPLFRDLAPVAERFRERRRRRPDGPLLISDECLAGASYFGFHDSNDIAEALAALFPGAKVFFVVRRQDDFVESLYKQSLHEYHAVPVRTFLGGDADAIAAGRTQQRILDRPYPHADVATLDWGRYVANYERLFGRDNVLVLPFELMRADLGSFLRRFQAFAGLSGPIPQQAVASNRSYGRLAARAAFVLNGLVWTEYRAWGVIPNRPFLRFAPRPWIRRLIRTVSLESLLLSTVDRLPFGRGPLLDARTRSAVLSFHADGNRRLDLARHLDLASYGYY